MKACGLIVEYNPLHNGHLYHLENAKKATNADLIIAIMSGTFLQRGEPAIIDKIHRTNAALDAGADIVLELPYPYAVQSSELFAKGAIFSLFEMGVTSICFGSETGLINPFIKSYTEIEKHLDKYNLVLKEHLNKGLSFPSASGKAYEAIGLDGTLFNQPNNILGFSYVKTILKNNLPITPFTIRRIQNDYHDKNIAHSMASATSIRKKLLENPFSNVVSATLPSYSLQLLRRYYEITNGFHHWEKYFPFIHYRVLTIRVEELRLIHGIDEGIEYRLKNTAKHAKSFADWLNKMKTKRYTKTRLQRIFAHILTNTTKAEIEPFISHPSVPYIRILGMNALGQKYVSNRRDEMAIPIITRLSQKHANLIRTDEKATDTYYSILPPIIREELKAAELQLPIRKQ